MKPSYIISAYGILWRFRHHKMILMLEEIKRTGTTDFNNYGRVIGEVDFNLTDVDDPDLAKDILERFRLRQLLKDKSNAQINQTNRSRNSDRSSDSE